MRFASIISGWAVLALCWVGCDAPPLFEKVPMQRSGLTFTNKLDETEDFNIIKYLYFYNGGGVCAGDVTGDGLPDLFFTSNQGANRLYRNLGNWQFEDITERAGLAAPQQAQTQWTTGATMADVNGDGWLDIYVCVVSGFRKLKGHNLLYLNNGDGTFTESAVQYGLDFRGYAQHAAFFDYDRDGDLDLYLLCHAVHSAEVYVPGENRMHRDSLAGDRLYRNDGDHFTDVSTQAGIFGGPMGYGLAVGVADLDRNGWPDIYVSNDFHEHDYLYLNNGDGTFREVIQQATGHISTFSMGNDLADYDNDGWIDIVTLDMKPDDEVVYKRSVGADPYNIYQHKLNFGYHYQYPRNMLQRNMGVLTDSLVHFAEIGQWAGIATTDWSWAPLLADYDLDGWKDLFVTNGIWRRPNDLDYLKYISNQAIQESASDLELANHMPPGIVPNFAFRNRGDGTFETVSKRWGLADVGCSNGAAWADLDADGDLDLIVNNLGEPASLYRNRAVEQGKGHFLRVRLQGPSGNPFGLGTRVQVHTPQGRQVQELWTTRGWLSSVEPLLIFGLGQADSATLVVQWPDGRQQRLSAKADATLVLRHADAAPSMPQPAQTVQPLFREIADRLGIDFVHREDDFTDFDIEKLLPFMLSTEGPAFAKGDVNGDGYDDLFFGGARGQAGALYVQVFEQGRAAFRQMQRFEEAALSEDVDAAFFDADGDGDLDLYVASGGNAFPGNAPQLADRLYRNDGTGYFVLANDALPSIYENTACVVPADFDADGDLDLFVGTRSVTGHYGRPPRSHVLLNDGAAHFAEAEMPWAAPLRQLGMVTDACWLPQRRELLVAGDFLPLTFYRIEAGRILKLELPDSHGWWRRLHAADLDGDGDIDILAGNMGFNSPFIATPDEPVELFSADFDRNFSTDPILTYFRHGQRYPFAARDELLAQLVGLRKAYSNYVSYAQASFDEIIQYLTPLQVNYYRISKLASVWIEQSDDGRMRMHPLPADGQWSALYAFTANDYDGDGYIDLLAGGNLYGVQPAIGRYDASFGHLWLQVPTFRQTEPRDTGLTLFGQVRHLCTLTLVDGRKAVIAVRNDATPQVFVLTNSALQ